MEGKIIKKDDDRNKDIENNDQEDLYYDGKRYYTKEEFFNPDDDKGELSPKKSKKWLKITIASVLILALLSNVLAMWPRIFNLPAIEFLAKSQELSENENVQLYKESIVIVRAGNSKGTGFLFSNDGYIMTNHHVVDNDKYPVITFEDGDSYRSEVIKSDEEIDIAILKINEEVDYHALHFDDSWENDEPVYVIGNPLFFNFIANEGNILETSLQHRIDPLLMIDAPIYQGSSGSPVINHKGKVVGVIYATTRVDRDGSRKKVGLAVKVDSFIEHMNGLIFE